MQPVSPRRIEESDRERQDANRARRSTSACKLDTIACLALHSACSRDLQAIDAKRKSLDAATFPDVRRGSRRSPQALCISVEILMECFTASAYHAPKQSRVSLIPQINVPVDLHLDADF